MAEAIPVKVALRCRPMSAKEAAEGCQCCLEFIPNEPQVIIGSNRSFTYDFVFSPDTMQEHVYATSIKPLLSNIFKGYNVTVLAYGQTGSGKTYTMGTVFSPSIRAQDSKLGVIPRAVNDLFSGMVQQPDREFYTKVSFIEIYKEDVLDLLNPGAAKEEVIIREDPAGGMKLAGLNEVPVSNLEETMNCLERGSLIRTTGATAMNAHSSRSHAIFTISVEGKSSSDKNCCFVSKFHFVDLAGSERAKKTKAEGDRFKEGVNINLGLLALGNVISALCEGSSRNHVPYRESKLTRLLQDSLGGNSHTIMIACVSPADSNLEETLNTLRYAHRARKIKNKPVVNRDPTTAEIARLKQLVQQLQVQLVNYQVGDGVKLENGPSTPVSGEKVKVLLERIEELETENAKLAHELQLAIEQTTELCEKVIVSDMKHDRMKLHLEELSQTTGVTLEIFNQSVDMEKNPQMKEKLDLIQGLKNKVLDIQAEQNKSAVLAGNEDEGLCQKTDETENQENTHMCDKETTLRQAEMNRQLQALNKVLAMKEELAGRLAVNDGKIDHMKEHYELNMKELEEEVATLQTEKEELSRALQMAHTNSANNKVSEQRRKRLKELEQQISELKKKTTEYDKIKRMKQQSDEQVKKLNQEIVEMKQARVRLVRQMKAEAEKQKQWKLEKEKEVCRLKQKERRCQVEIVRKQQQFDKQQNVLKRKMEEAMAVNKRLKEALLQQKLQSDRRHKEQDQSVQQRVKKHLEQDFNLAVSAKEASHHLQSLMEDRRTVSGQLNKLQKKLQREEQGSSSSLSTCSSTDEMSGESIPILELKQRIADLEADIELRNIQITDFQQKIIDADQEDKGKVRWGTIQVMSDAKVGLKLLFDMCVSSKCESNVTQCKLSELEKEYVEANKALNALRNETETMKLTYEQKVTEMQKEHHEKVLFLLCQLSKSSAREITPLNLDQPSAERLNVIMDDELALVGSLKNQLEERTEECERLKMELQQVRLYGAGLPQCPTISVMPSPPKKKKQGRDMLKRELLYYDEPSTSEESFDDNTEVDPDWHKTPLAHRLRALKSKDKILRAKIEPSLLETSKYEFESTEQLSLRGKKRKSEEQRCSCQTGCRTKRCSCFKRAERCRDKCTCKDCLNGITVTSS